MSDTLRGSIYGITAAAIWGGMYVVSDVVLEIIPPFSLLTLRLLLGGMVLGILLWRQTDWQLPYWRDLGQMFGVGIVGFGISLGAQFVGTHLSNAVNGSLITSASPAFILLFAPFILGEKLNARLIFAVILATLGVIIIIDPAKADFGSDTFLGDVALALAALTWGLYSVLVRWVSRGFNTFLITLTAFLGGLTLTVPAALLELTQREIGQITPITILGILYLGIISTAGAMWLWNRAFALVEASTASLFFFDQPLVGAVLGVLLLGQAFTLPLGIGSAFIIGGVLVSIYSPNHS